MGHFLCHLSQKEHTHTVHVFTQVPSFIMYSRIAHPLVEGDSYSSVSGQVLVNEGHHNAIVEFSACNKKINRGIGVKNMHASMTQAQ